MRDSIAILLFFTLFFLAGGLRAQSIDKIVNPAAVEAIERVLSADSLEGRGNFTPGIERAARFIETQFRMAGLKSWNGGRSFRQPFSMINMKVLSVKGVFDGVAIDTGSSIVLFSASTDLRIDQTGGYEKIHIRPGDNFFAKAIQAVQTKKNQLVLVDTSFSKYFGRLKYFARQQFKSDYNILFVLTNQDPAHYNIAIGQELVKESKLVNMVGILPGKRRKNEYVIFSGHYDHLGIGKPDSRGDSIYNGANDDASGTTAVMMLARYFAKRRNNERTLVFATFAAEEIGEFGSQYFSWQFDPAKVSAMFNIEMIGTESKWGTNSAYITGYERTDMGKILQQNLEGSKFRFYPDPYPEQSLFYRSDNATLARQGVPAHTLSTSKMDSEKYYHTQGDEIGTLDMKNMAEIIKAIAVSSSSIVAGKDTPTRVDTGQLR
ncbi:MAG: M28 family peptidase [Puia sp.]|nr:M28 family peptidase [Puia sp.]